MSLKIKSFIVFLSAKIMSFLCLHSSLNVGWITTSKNFVLGGGSEMRSAKFNKSLRFKMMTLLQTGQPHLIFKNFY